MFPLSDGPNKLTIEWRFHFADQWIINGMPRALSSDQTMIGPFHLNLYDQWSRYVYIEQSKLAERLHLQKEQNIIIVIWTWPIWAADPQANVCPEGASALPDSLSFPRRPSASEATGLAGSWANGRTIYIGVGWIEMDVCPFRRRICERRHVQSLDSRHIWNDQMHACTWFSLEVFVHDGVHCSITCMPPGVIEQLGLRAVLGAKNMCTIIWSVVVQAQCESTLFSQIHFLIELSQ
jgi:hypothetical protein